MSTEEIIRDREELSEQIRALRELLEMAESYGFDISGRRAMRTRRCNGFIFAYLAAVKEQNGAAMSLGRTSTFLDIYFERDLAAGRSMNRKRRRSLMISSSNCGSCDSADSGI